MQEMIFDVVNAIVTAAIATVLWYVYAAKGNDHGGRRDR